MSTEDLKLRLKEALSTIREKERDLIIAAEIGQQLVAANTSLVSEYEELLARTATGTTSPTSPPASKPIQIPRTTHAMPIATTTPPSTPPTPHADLSSSPTIPAPFTTAAAVKASKRASLSLSMSRLALTVPPPTPAADIVPDPEPEPGTAPDPKPRTAGAPASITDYVSSLERANADLRAQLTVAVQNLADADRVHARSLAQLRRHNAKLQDQLRATLQDLRDAERSHGAAVAGLEADLEKLRADLGSAAMVAQELEGERRRAVRERVEAVREAQGVEIEDTRTIQELRARLRECEGELAGARVGRKEAERRMRVAVEEVERLREANGVLEEKAEEVTGLRAECARLEAVVAEMREQLEEQRDERVEREVLSLQSGGVAAKGERVRLEKGKDGEMAVVLAGSPQQWEWTPWLNSIKSKCWDRDIQGLTAEVTFSFSFGTGLTENGQQIDNLRQHRVEAYQRLRSEMDVMMGTLVSVLPTSIQSITTRVVGIPSSPSMGSAGSSSICLLLGLFERGEPVGLWSSQFSQPLPFNTSGQRNDGGGYPGPKKKMSSTSPPTPPTHPPPTPSSSSSIPVPSPQASARGGAASPAGAPSAMDLRMGGATSPPPHPAHHYQRHHHRSPSSSTSSATSSSAHPRRAASTTSAPATTATTTPSRPPPFASPPRRAASTLHPATEDAIRRNIELELASRKRRSTASSSSSAISAVPSVPLGRASPTRLATTFRDRPRRGTVAAMHPAPAVALLETARAVDAAAQMAAKRVDAVLVVDAAGHLAGIVTDKDMAFRVVAEGLDPRATPVGDVMTHNPVSVGTTGPAADALNKMVAGHFRHLPVIDDADPSGIDAPVAVLDITKCLHDALDRLDRAAPASPSADLLREHLQLPDVASILRVDPPPAAVPVVAAHESVLEAARRMRAARETAALVVDGEGALAGIFTSKDLVLRVVAAGLEPAGTPVGRVMTPHPDCVAGETPVVEALKKMHAGRYLHLPVVDPQGAVEGLIDVLKLTYTIFTHLTSIPLDPTTQDPSSSTTPLWHRLWDSGTTDATASDADSDLSAANASNATPANPLSHSIGSAGSSGSGGPRRRRSANAVRASWTPGRPFTPPTPLAPPPATSQPDPSTLLRQLAASPDPSTASGADAGDDSTVLPDDSASRVAAAVDTPPPPPLRPRPAASALRGGTPAAASELGPDDSAVGEEAFTYKLRDVEGGKVHRLVVAPATSLAALTAAVAARLGRVGGGDVGISYVDDEGDAVHLGCDADLEEAVGVARALGWRRLVVVLDAQVGAARRGVGVGSEAGSGVGRASAVSL
ncbi:hypothetical protein HDU96_009297, partial [Phlyctochytrium bullatum]